MQLATELKAAGLGVFPCVAHFNPTKQKWEKRPLTVDKEPWAVTAIRPLDDPAVRWGGVKVVGIPVPVGVFVVDLDSYKKGTTREAVEAAWGCRLDWDNALIQRTIGGGEHYAFRLPAWEVRQGGNLGGVGVDTRTPGKGFICSGEGYTPVGFGVMRMAFPDSLPSIPDEARAVLEVPQDIPPAPPPPDLVQDEEITRIEEALSHLDPDCPHDIWILRAMELRHHFKNDPDTGFDLFNRWSIGMIGDRDCPPSYDPDEVNYQFYALKPERPGDKNRSINSLFYAAIAAGWQPPASFDTSLAFGEGAVPATQFNQLIELIMERGADSKATADILEAIRQAGCNALQATLLRNELKAALRSARILDKDLTALIDASVNVEAGLPPNLGYNKSHPNNVELFLATHYPDGQLMNVDQNWYAFNGKCWEEIDDAEVDKQITNAMWASQPQRPVVTGTYATLASVCRQSNIDMHQSPEGLIIFNNGVLDIYSGQLHPHDKKYLTTKMVPYDFDPNATAPRWVAFLEEVFEGDKERIALLQEWFGYMLSPTYQYQKIMLLIGPKRAGKSTIGEILHAIVGDQNYTGASLESFAADDFLDSLRHKTVAFSGDTQKAVNAHRVHQVIERLKKISGCDAVDFGRKYKSRLSTRLPTRITISANGVPRLFDDSGALAGRLLVLPFDVSFADREDPYLDKKLLGELAGIALWSLQGLARLNQNQRFTMPAASREEMESIAEQYSPLRAFVGEEVTTGGADDVVTSEDLYNAYRAWAVLEGENHVLARKAFVGAFKDATRGRGVKYGAHRTGEEVTRGFRGVRLVKEAPPTAGAFQPKVVK